MERRNEMDELVRRGIRFYNKGDYESAIREYNTAIENNPNISKYYNFRGMAYFYNKQNDRAIMDYKKALELDPTNGDIKKRLDWAIAAIEKKEEAGQIAKRPMNINRNTGSQKHTENPEVQRFIRRVFNHYAKNELSKEPTPGDKGQRESEIKEKYRDKEDFCLIRLTRGKGQGINFYWNEDRAINKEKYCAGYISGDYNGKIPNDAYPQIKDALKKKCPERQWNADYWNEHFDEFIKALGSGLHAVYEAWKAGQSG